MIQQCKRVFFASQWKDPLKRFLWNLGKTKKQVSSQPHPWLTASLAATIIGGNGESAHPHTEWLMRVTACYCIHSFKKIKVCDLKKKNPF